MALPFFYAAAVNGTDPVLDETNSHHAVAVLRMQAGEQLHLTDGRGHLYTARIVEAHKKHCALQITNSVYTAPVANPVTIAVSPLKNASRLEWFLEKATEMGVHSIRLIQCRRTEKQQVRTGRLQQILVSAMLQSQRSWLPELEGPLPFEQVLSSVADQRYIAHCLETDRVSLREAVQRAGSKLLLVGPEGDFTPDEIASALAAGFRAVTLGDARLRTETAALVGAGLLCVF
ncbi:MAG: RsmE family RNA methyltransferase [Flavihumibacter sp.]